MTRRGFDRGTSDKPFGTGFADEVASNVAGQLGAIFTLKPQAKYMSGARCVLRINGEIVGFAFQVSWSVRTDGTEIQTIDDALPWEIAPTRISVSGTLGMFQVPGESPQSNLWQSDAFSFLMNRYITIEVKDSATDAIIFRTGAAMIVGQDSNINSEQLGQTTLHWRAVGWQVETRPAAIDDSEMEKRPDDPGGIGGALATAAKNLTKAFG